jgi:hypothetical protein
MPCMHCNTPTKCGVYGCCPGTCPSERVTATEVNLRMSEAAARLRRAQDALFSSMFASAWALIWAQLNLDKIRQQRLLTYIPKGTDHE